MTTKNGRRLLALSPCAGSLARVGAHPTLRAWWDDGDGDVSWDMAWLIGLAHSRGTLPRCRLVGVAVACAETAADLLPDEARPHLATVASWARGDADVTAGDLRRARIALLEIRDSADAAYAAAAAADGGGRAHAAYAATAAVYAATTYAATCDVIRDAITIDEVCAALGLDPDQGVI